MISEHIKEFPALFESCLERCYPEAGMDTPMIDEAMRYSLLGGGKRLRPMLMAASYEAFAGKCWDEDRQLEVFMTALEMIHTYSLIHDDLPAMDNDDIRRGKRTNHLVFGEDVAILAGDGLLNGAFEIMADAISKDENHRDRAVEAMRRIARSAGSKGMIGGQVIDVIGYATEPHRLIDMYKKKTGELLSAALVGGALLGGAGEADLTRMEEIALKTGIAFQIQDDILDVTGEQEVLGKPVGSDKEREQITFVSFYGLDKAGEEADRYLAEALAALDEIDGEQETLRMLIASLAGRSK